MAGERVITPVALDAAELFLRTIHLGDIAEVGVEFECEFKGGCVLREIAEVDVLVQPAADVAGDAHFERALGVVFHCAAALIGRHLGDGRRVHDVITEPGVLFHVRREDALWLLAVDQQPILRKQPRLVDEETVLRTAIDEAVSIEREHGAVLADVNGVRLRAQQRHRPGKGRGAGASH